MDAGYYYRLNRKNGFLDNSSSSALPPLPLLFFSFISDLFLTLSWYLRHESAFEGFIDQIKVVVVVSPLVLLFVVRWFSGADRRWVPYLFPFPESKESAMDGDGSSPWGVAVMLVLLLFMVSYQSYFH